MAAPKVLRSPGSAGRPENVKSPVSSVDEDIAAMEALSESDLADLSAMESIDLGQTPSGIPISQQTGEFGTGAELEAMAKSFVPSRGTVADIGASLATQIPARVGALAATTPLGPVVQYGAQSLAGAGIAAVEKDVANLFRRALGAPEDEERNRLTDVATSLLFDIPGVAIGAGKYLAGSLDISKDLAKKSGQEILKSLPPELSQSLSLMKSSIQKTMEGVLDPEQAAKQVANLESDFVGLMSKGYSPKEAASRVSQKYSFQIQANKAKDDLLNSIGSEFSKEEFLKGVVSRPQNILEIKRQRAGNQIGVAFEAIKQTKGLDQIDSSRFLNELRISLKEAQGIGDQPLVDNIKSIMDALGERQKLKTQYNDLAQFSKETGGKVPKLMDVSTGAELEIGKPVSQEGGTSFLPPKVADENENFVMQSIQNLIKKRMSLDKSISETEKGSIRNAKLRAVSALRNIEDEFMLNLSKQGGDIGKIADSYMSAKQSYNSLSDAIENMGNLTKRDAIGMSKAIESGNVDQIKAWASVMPQNVKDKVSRRYVEGILDLSSGTPDMPYTKEQFKKIESALNGNLRESKLQLMIGKERSSKIVSDIKQFGNLVNAASQLPEGAGPERAVIRKLFSQIEGLSKKYGLNFIYGGRMALDPNTRAYRDFLNYMMSKDFDVVAKSIDNAADVAITSSELNRVFGSKHPNTQRFMNFVQSSGLLPYVGGVPTARAAVGSAFRGGESEQQ